MKGLVLLTIAVAMCTICGRPNTSKAEILRPNVQTQNRELEIRVQRLENEVHRGNRVLEQLHHRLSVLERKSDDDRRRPRPPREEATYACMITDIGYKKTFLGTADTEIGAKYEAKANCDKKVNSSYCRVSDAKCDSNLDDPRVSKYTCIVIDIGYKRAFRGVGATKIAAEAQAKQNCQESVNASYCGNVEPNCEASYYR